MASVWGNRLYLTEHVIVLGVPQSGKTYFAKRLVSSANRVVYFDPAGDYEDCGKVIRPAELENPDLLKGKHLRLTIAANRSDDVTAAEEFIYIQRRCREAKQHGGLVLVCDEIGAYKQEAFNSLNQMFMNGHHDLIVPVFVSQRAVHIPTDCRASATTVYSFRQESPEDMVWLMKAGWGEDFAKRCKVWQAGQPPITYKRAPIYPRS
jgi:hypothetical protein